MEMTMNKKITVTVNGVAHLAAAGATISEIISGEKPCGGHGRCGKCRVVARGELSEPTEAERAHLGDAIFRGVRLACVTRALGDCTIEPLDGRSDVQIMSEGVQKISSISPSFSCYGVAIDLGTTTLAARLYDRSGNMLAHASGLNPQIEWGADVISRIEAALSGQGAALAASIRSAIDSMIGELACACALSSLQIDAVILTGNTVMLHLLTEQSVEPLSRAPFIAERLFGESLTAGELSLSSLAPDTEVYLPRCMGAFVGADIVCAVAATGITKCGTPAMLADIGTNGEIALWNGDRLAVCSTAAGPAFEGVGISMGMRGATGAIDRVSLEGGELSAHVIGNTEARGICGSGLIDAVACLLDTEQIDETGFMEEDEVFVLPPVSLNQSDVRALQLAKSAICAGMLTLLDRLKLSVADIAALYIAGGFGSYLDPTNAERIGLLPPGSSGKVTSVGNAALDGASMLLFDTALRQACDSIAERAEVISLSSNKNFSEYYMSGMLFGEL